MSSQFSPIDPVCGMVLRPDLVGKLKRKFQGTTYSFCCGECAEIFDRDPAAAIRRTPAPLDLNERVPAHAAQLGGYLCPMHPEIFQSIPGDCPKCGMALEWVGGVPPADEADPTERDLKLRLGVGVLLGVPAFVLGMAELSESWAGPAQMALVLPVVFYCGWPLLKKGALSLVHRSPNMFTLIAMGVLSATAYSVAALVAPEAFPHSARMHGHAVGLYFESASTVTVFALLGQWLEAIGRRRAGGAIRALLSLVPARVRRVVGDAQSQNFEEIAIADVRMGDLLQIRVGEAFAVDGEIVEGQTAIDESRITGESLPVEKGPNARVTSGTINLVTPVVMRATRVGSDTLIARMAQAVSEAQRTRAPIQNLADRISEYFVPAVVLTAIASLVGWLVFGDGSFELRLMQGLICAVAVLIVACPCALGLATPMAMLVGAGRGAREGVLVRDVAALQSLSEVKRVVFDKTGTLTQGKPRLTDIESLDAAWDRSKLLSIAAELERSSEHVLAGPVLLAAREAGAEELKATKIRVIPGKGIEGVIDGLGRVRLGKPNWVREIALHIELARGAGRVALAAEKHPLAWLRLEDPLRTDAAELVDRLRAQGLQIALASGDHPDTVARVAGQLGITEFRGGLLPEQKAEWVQELQLAGPLAFAGDGVNDAPSLSVARVGVAMGSGTDVAAQAAGLILVKGELSALSRAVRLSRQVMRIVKQNLFLAFIYNAACIPLAALGWLTPMWAAAAMSVSSVSVIGNSLRLRGRQY